MVVLWLNENAIDSERCTQQQTCLHIKAICMKKNTLASLFHGLAKDEPDLNFQFPLNIASHVWFICWVQSSSINDTQIYCSFYRINYVCFSDTATNNARNSLTTNYLQMVLSSLFFVPNTLVLTDI